jgi:hypothetical protein
VNDVENDVGEKEELKTGEDVFNEDDACLVVHSCPFMNLLKSWHLYSCLLILWRL